MEEKPPELTHGISLESLKKFQEAGWEAEKARRERQKAESLRYYGERNDAGTAAAAAMRTDDGHLTKFGARKTCVVCCQEGHKAFECPNLRCRHCFRTGHTAHKCPKAQTKCPRCARKGHDGDSCPWFLMFA